MASSICRFFCWCVREKQYTIALLVWLWLLSILFSFCWHFEKTTPKCCISSFSSNFRETETATSFHVLVRYDFFLQIKKIAVPSREIRDWMELDLIISWHHCYFRCTGWFVALGQSACPPAVYFLKSCPLQA
jgi:hypothetical protein